MYLTESATESDAPIRHKSILAAAVHAAMHVKLVVALSLTPPRK
jgi:hypothetical protein